MRLVIEETILGDANTVIFLDGPLRDLLYLDSVDDAFIESHTGG